MDIFRHLDAYTCLSIGTLIACCIIGDYALAEVSNKNFPILARACVDSATHALVAALSWVVVMHEVTRETVLCGVLASLVDVDHFVTARSFSLSDAVSLDRRPPLHNSLLLLIVSVGTLAAGKVLNTQWLVRSSWLFIVAWTSHHVRDGCRHGLWFGPWSTPPYTQWMYIALIVLMPLALRLRLHEVRELSTTSTLDV